MAAGRGIYHDRRRLTVLFTHGIRHKSAILHSRIFFDECMICRKCGAETPAPLENCIVCSTLLPAPPSLQTASGESLSEFRTMQPAAVAAPGKSDGPLQAGQSLGRYRIDKMLGSGGM